MRRLFLALGLLLGLALPSLGQIQPVPQPGVQFFDNNGSPLAGGKICSFSAGTTSPLATYSDAGGTVNTNPVILDSAGRATIWFGAFSYKLVLMTAGTDNTCNTGSIIRTDDNIPGAGQSVASAAFSALTAGTNSHAGIFAMSGNTLDLSGATAAIVPSGAGAAPTANGRLGYDTTANRYIFGANGASKQIVYAGADINTSDQVTVTHLAAALPTAQGGTGSTSASTGSGGVVLATSPTIATPILTTPTSTNAKFNTGVANNGTGFQHLRFTSCNTNGSFCSSSANWPSAFADTNYTAVCIALHATDRDFVNLDSKTGAAITYTTTSYASASVTPEIDCIGVHD